MKQVHVLFPAVLALKGFLKLVRFTEVLMTGHLIPTVDAFFAATHRYHRITMFLPISINVLLQFMPLNVFLIRKREVCFWS